MCSMYYDYIISTLNKLGNSTSSTKCALPNSWETSFDTDKNKTERKWRFSVLVRLLYIVKKARQDFLEEDNDIYIELKLCAPRISFRREACGSSVQLHSNSVLVTCCPILSEFDNQPKWTAKSDARPAAPTNAKSQKVTPFRVSLVATALVFDRGHARF